MNGELVRDVLYEYQSHLLLAAAGLSVYWLYSTRFGTHVLCYVIPVLYCTIPLFLTDCPTPCI